MTKRIAIIWTLTTDLEAVRVSWVDTKEEVIDWVQTKIVEESVGGFNIRKMFTADYDKYLKKGVVDFA